MKEGHWARDISRESDSRADVAKPPWLKEDILNCFPDRLRYFSKKVPRVRAFWSACVCICLVYITSITV